MKEGNTIAPYTFRRVSNVYTPVKYELTGCIAGLNVVFPWLDLNIKSYDNIHMWTMGFKNASVVSALIENNGYLVIMW